MDANLSAAARLSLVRTLLREASAGDVRWDAAVQSYLAARAVTADFGREAYPHAASQIASVDSALANVRQYLGNACFAAASRDNRRPTQYDSPTDFAPQPLAERMELVSAALQQLEAAIAASGAR